VLKHDCGAKLVPNAQAAVCAEGTYSTVDSAEGDKLYIA